jgi:hypothetical protein
MLRWSRANKLEYIRNPKRKLSDFTKMRPNTIQPAVTERVPSAVEILDWIERKAESIFIQPIPPGRRAKNRAVVQFRDSAGEVKAIGAPTIAAAVARARLREHVTITNLQSVAKGE